jgi:hypothetical protein
LFSLSCSQFQATRPPSMSLFKSIPILFYVVDRSFAPICTSVKPQLPKSKNGARVFLFSSIRRRASSDTGVGSMMGDG